MATPIGNLEDFSARALTTLATVDFIVAEDTRHTGRMLARLGIKAQLRALHEHNETRIAPELAGAIAAGQRIALVSDAGTPLISDPGFALVDAVLARGARVIPIPGPCAMTAALSVCGLATDRFAFEGFLPARRQARLARLEMLGYETRTVVLYEAPHRIAAMLADCVVALGAERQITVAKELTKIHEQVFRGSSADALVWLESDPARVRGEFVVAITGAAAAAPPRADWHADLKILLEELPPARAARVLAKMSGVARKTIYEHALHLAHETGE